MKTIKQTIQWLLGTYALRLRVAELEKSRATFEKDIEYAFSLFIDKYNIENNAIDLKHRTFHSQISDLFQADNKNRLDIFREIRNLQSQINDMQFADAEKVGKATEHKKVRLVKVSETDYKILCPTTRPTHYLIDVKGKGKKGIATLETIKTRKQVKVQIR